MFLLGSADFMRRGLADGFADGRPGHAVLSGGDAVRQRLSRHITEEAGGMVEGGKPGMIKMSLATGRVPSAQIARLKRRAYTDVDPMSEFIRRPNKT